MKLRYTVEIDFGDDADITSDVQSECVMREAFDLVGDWLCGQEIHHLTIWPHDGSQPATAVPGVAQDAPIPDSECPACGIQQFTGRATA